MSKGGIKRTLTTDEAGEYNAPNLTPGTYTVHAEAKGFKNFERTSILLETGKRTARGFIAAARRAVPDDYHHERSAHGGNHQRHSGRHAEQ